MFTNKVKLQKVMASNKYKCYFGNHSNFLNAMEDAEKHLAQLSYENVSTLKTKNRIVFLQLLFIVVYKNNLG